MSTEQERAAFEAWHAEKYWTPLFDDELGRFTPTVVQNRFEAYQAGRSALQSQDRGDAEFELIQDGTPMASTFGKREDALREIQHYAAVYSQDGPVEIYEVTRRRIEEEA